MNDKELLKKVREIYDRGDRSFAIYPVGNHGRRVLDLISLYFDLEDIILVDNSYSHYSKRIISFEEFAEIYTDETIVILTTEDPLLNSKMENELLEFVRSDRLVNLWSPYCVTSWNLDPCFVGTNLSLDSIIPRADAPCSKDNRFKIRFIHESVVSWNAVSSIFKAFQNDDKYEVAVLIIHNNERTREQLDRFSAHYVEIKDYDVSIDNPDIFFVCNVYRDYCLGNIRDYSRLIIAPLNALIRYEGSTRRFLELVGYGIEAYNPDYYLCDSFLYRKLKDSIIGDRLIEMGNPKYDGIFEACNNGEYPEKWIKLKNKRVILWMIDHDICYYDRHVAMTPGESFDCYAKSVFQYFYTHTDIGLIFRAHPVFISELIEYNLWSEEDIIKFRSWCDSTENIVWDENDTYDSAFGVSDAIMTDAWCGTTCSSLPTMKPICILYRPGMDVHSYEPELTDCYYSARSVGDMIAYLEMISRNEDPMFNLRWEASQNHVKSFDGKNGMRIKEFCERKLLEMERQGE